MAPATRPMCQAQDPASACDVVAGDALSDDGEPPPLLQEALAAHQLLGASYKLHAGTPLPEALLSTARLHAMSEAELWLHDPPPWTVRPPPVPFISACSEWHALTRLRNALSPCRHAQTAKAQVESLLLALGNVPPEPSPLRLHPTDAAARAFLASSGGRGNVRVAQCAVGGRGLVAGCAVPAGGCAVSLPAGALISAATARAELPAGVVRLLSREGPWADHLQVMLLLMRERWRGQASPLAPALALLPSPVEEAGPPSAWGEGELGCLAGTDAYWSAHAARGELIELRESLMPKLEPLLGIPQGVLEGNTAPPLKIPQEGLAQGGSDERRATAGRGIETGAEVGTAARAGTATEASGTGETGKVARSGVEGLLPGAGVGAGAAASAPAPPACGGASDAYSEDAYSEASWLWAKSVLDTRAMALPADLGPDLPQGTLVLAPVIDMANHAQAPKLSLDIEQGTDGRGEARLCLRATAPVAPGEQLFINYGRFDAQELFLHYGIPPPEVPPLTIGEADTPPHAGGAPEVFPLSPIGVADTPLHAGGPPRVCGVGTGPAVTGAAPDVQPRQGPTLPLSAPDPPAETPFTVTPPALPPPAALTAALPPPPPPPAALSPPPLLLRFSLTPCAPLEEDETLLGRVLLLMAHLGLGMDVEVPVHTHAGVGFMGQLGEMAAGVCNVAEMAPGGIRTPDAYHATQGGDLTPSFYSEAAREPSIGGIRPPDASHATHGAGLPPCSYPEAAREPSIGHPRIPPLGTHSTPSALSAAAALPSLPALPHRLLGTARLLAVTSDAELGRLPVARAAGAAPLSPANEAAALRLLSRCCEEAIGAIEGGAMGVAEGGDTEGGGGEGAGEESSEGGEGEMEGGDGQGLGARAVSSRSGRKRQRLAAPGANTGGEADSATDQDDAARKAVYIGGGLAHLGRRRVALAFRAQVLRGYRQLYDAVRAHAQQVSYRTACPGSK